MKVIELINILEQFEEQLEVRFHVPEYIDNISESIHGDVDIVISNVERELEGVEGTSFVRIS
jgi:hypothetical protein